MPIATTYKGIRIHVQPAKRIALVKKEIDKINNIGDLVQLVEVAADVAWPPEARTVCLMRITNAQRHATSHCRTWNEWTSSSSTTASMPR